MSQPPVSGVFRAVWPVVDTTYSRDELIAEAQLALAGLAAAADVIVTGPAAFDTTRTGSEVPGWEDWDGYVLVAEAPARARRTPDPVAPVDLPTYIDWVVVERALAAAAPRKLTKIEKKAAVADGIRRGMSYKELADLLKMGWVTVRDYAQADPAEWTVAA
ncbi:hypothetical protein [Glycomyces artemisiae]|uniref:Uncharacterized protein n=1 Tax=Glycomyces artemisiae TaxID=1076443 RepID=A0A2T0U6H1_9ACTN|nr:hypothetical protein [Glycomyces artemisiae]PRY53511.1 hypothetical protein B0I28_11710 [Glycomyces artemisiae]